jgi:hypothetical protein
MSEYAKYEKEKKQKDYHVEMAGQEKFERPRGKNKKRPSKK